MNKARVSLVSTVTAGYANYMRAHKAVKEKKRLLGLETGLSVFRSG